MDNEKSPLIIKARRFRSVCIMVLAFLMSALCLGLIVISLYSINHGNLIYPSIPVVITLLLMDIFLLYAMYFFLRGIPACIKLISQRENALIIDENGITDYSCVSALGFIPWDAIKSVRTFGDATKVHNRSGILIELENPDSFILQYTPKEQKAIMKSHRWGFGHTSILSSNVGITPAFLLSKIMEFYHR